MRHRSKSAETGGGLLGKYTKLPIKKRLSTHDIRSKWTEKEKAACGNLLLQFLKDKSKVFWSVESDEIQETMNVDVVKEFEDRLEFTLSPFPNVHDPSFLSDLDAELRSTLPGFGVRLRSDARTQTFFSPEDKNQSFTAKTYSDALVPCFVYRRTRIMDPFCIFAGAVIVFLLILCYLFLFRSIYSREGYSFSLAFNEVLRAFF